MGDVLLCTTTGCMLVGSITKGDGTTTSYAKPYRAHARVYIERDTTPLVGCLSLQSTLPVPLRVST